MSDLNFYNLVHEDIAAVEDRMLSQASHDFKDLKKALNHLLRSGGKRVRPTLTMVVGRMLRGDRQKLITLAAAIEMLHTATLVHDDLIDGALLRRGIPTINAYWSPAATVLTGDYLFARAAGLAAQADSLSAMRLFADTLAVIVNGEITQLFTKIGDTGVPTIEDYVHRIEAKTASLFRTSTMVAALVSPVEEEVVAWVGQYGYEIGMAFQIVDDVLDFTGDESTVGKPLGNDLRQGIITLPVIHYFKENPSQANLFDTLDTRQGKDNLDLLITLISNSSSISRSLEEARSYVERAIQALSNLPLSQERKALEELARFIIDRRV